MDTQASDRNAGCFFYFMGSCVNKKRDKLRNENRMKYKKVNRGICDEVVMKMVKKKAENTELLAEKVKRIELLLTARSPRRVLSVMRIWNSSKYQRNSQSIASAVSLLKLPPVGRSFLSIQISENRSSSESVAPSVCTTAQETRFAIESASFIDRPRHRPSSIVPQ